MKIVISKKWGHQPEVRLSIDDSGQSVEMGLDDFVEALIEEIGSVTWTFKKDTFKAQITEAVAAVIAEMKAQSIYNFVK